MLKSFISNYTYVIKQYYSVKHLYHLQGSLLTVYAFETFMAKYKE